MHREGSDRERASYNRLPYNEAARLPLADAPQGKMAVKRLQGESGMIAKCWATGSVTKGTTLSR